MTSQTATRPELSFTRPVDRKGLDWHEVVDCPGVSYAVLWHDGDFTHSLIRYAEGARTPGHPHLAAYHHLWIVSGAATVAGRRVAAGTYMVIPPGTAHPVTATGPDGCLMFQVHRPMPNPHQEGEAVAAPPGRPIRH